MSKPADLSRTLRALAEETRLRMLHLLLHEGELCVCDMEAILGVTQSKASRHLNYLRQARIVQDRRDGTWVYYRLSREAPAAVIALVRSLRAELAEDPVALDDLARAEARRRDPACVSMQPVAGGRRRGAGA